MLIRLTYASRSARPISKMDIRDILTAAWNHNAAHNISGMLCHGNNRFLQYLEGEKAAVDDLYARIQNDARHKDVLLIERTTIDGRRFSDWSMGYVDAMEQHVMDVIREVTTKNSFEPEELAPENVINLVAGLKSSIHPQFSIKLDQSDI